MNNIRNRAYILFDEESLQITGITFSTNNELPFITVTRKLADDFIKYKKNLHDYEIVKGTTNFNIVKREYKEAGIYQKFKQYEEYHTDVDSLQTYDIDILYDHISSELHIQTNDINDFTHIYFTNRYKPNELILDIALEANTSDWKKVKLPKTFSLFTNNNINNIRLRHKHDNDIIGLNNPNYIVQIDEVKKLLAKYQLSIDINTLVSDLKVNNVCAIKHDEIVYLILNKSQFIRNYEYISFHSVFKHQPWLLKESFSMNKSKLEKHQLFKINPKLNVEHIVGVQEGFGSNNHVNIPLRQALAFDLEKDHTIDLKQQTEILLHALKKLSFKYNETDIKEYIEKNWLKQGICLIYHKSKLLIFPFSKKIIDLYYSNLDYEFELYNTVKDHHFLPNMSIPINKEKLIAGKMQTVTITLDSNMDKHLIGKNSQSNQYIKKMNYEVLYVD